METRDSSPQGAYTMKDYSEIKMIAKYQFPKQYGMCIGATLIYILLAESRMPQLVYRRNLNIYNEWVLAVLGIVFTIAMIIWLVQIFVGLPLKVGFAHFSRCVYNNQKTSVGDMFRKGFGDYARNLGGMLWMALFGFLWTLLLVIPGIIKMYAYSAAPYILAEFPNVRATDAIKLSMRMTNGYKGELFVLDLSFIGWFILSLLTFGLVGLLYVNPYYMTSRAGMYEELKQNALHTGRLSLEELTGYSV